MDHTEDLAGAYVLDALAPDERKAFEQHMEGCAACREEVAELRGVVGVLPLAAPRVEPPPSLGARIAALASGTPVEAPRRSRIRFSISSGLLVVAAVLVIALGIWNGALQQSLHQQQATGAYRLAVLQAISQRGSVSPMQGAASASAATAALIQPRGSQPGYLLVSNLSASPPGKVYQVWLTRGKTTHSAGTFHYSGLSGFGVVSLSLAAGGYSTVAMTIEPAPGSALPTGQKVLTGTLST